MGYQSLASVDPMWVHPNRIDSCFSKQRVARLNQPWTFVGRWILGATSGAAVIPDTYGLQAGNADDTTSFDNHTMFHEASLERPLGSGNALFGAGNNLSLKGSAVSSMRFASTV